MYIPNITCGFIIFHQQIFMISPLTPNIIPSFCSDIFHLLTPPVGSFLLFSGTTFFKFHIWVFSRSQVGVTGSRVLSTRTSPGVSVLPDRTCSHTSPPFWLHPSTSLLNCLYLSALNYVEVNTRGQLETWVDTQRRCWDMSHLMCPPSNTER